MIFKHLVFMRDYVQIVYLIFKYLVLALFFFYLFVNFAFYNLRAESF